MTSNLEQPITTKIYSDLQEAYNHFNRELFDGRLPDCLIVLSYKKGAYGYFRPAPFVTRDHLDDYDEWAKSFEESDDVDFQTAPGVDEISLNVFHFRERDVKAIMSTLVHEMCHLEQFRFGKPPKRATHNKEWGDMMKRVGLYPSATGAPGGKETGRRVSHYVIEGGAYERAFETLPVTLDWVGNLITRKKKSRTPKTTYACPECEAKVKGKADLHIRCEDCDAVMEPT